MNQRSTPVFEDYPRHTPSPLEVRPAPEDKLVHLRPSVGSFRTSCGLPAKAPGWRITVHGAAFNMKTDAADWCICVACARSDLVRLRAILMGAEGSDLTRSGLYITGATRKKKRAGRRETDDAFRKRCLERLDEKWWVYK